MSKIRIKNFGPIKEGYQENDGWMEVKKVTVFIGNQGSGKSTVAKVISTLTWLEKALNRGDISGFENQDDFQNYFDFQSLKSYFKKETLIEYHGNSYNILYDNSRNYCKTKSNQDGKTIKDKSNAYIVPQIMYVPAERNFLSVIRNAMGVKGLPEPLFDFAEELKTSQYESKGKNITLPINEAYYKYDEESDSSFIVGKDFDINLLVASSGFQSLVPLFLVSLSLAQNIKNGSRMTSHTYNRSVAQSIRMNSEIHKILDNKEFTDEIKAEKMKGIVAKFQNKAFINIVEEPEQNLFPSSQRQILNSLLEFNNMSEGNKLIMTTHSPYIINYLTLAVKAFKVCATIENNNSKNKVGNIVPLNSLLDPDDLVIYELNEKNGTIVKLKDYKGLPSDENFLNDSLAETNQLFSELQEIEKGWQ